MINNHTHSSHSCTCMFRGQVRILWHSTSRICPHRVPNIRYVHDISDHTVDHLQHVLQSSHQFLPRDVYQHVHRALTVAIRQKQDDFLLSRFSIIAYDFLLSLINISQN